MNDIYDLGFNNFLTIPSRFDEIASLASNVDDKVYVGTLGSGQTAAVVTVAKEGLYQSENFVTGVSGWRLDANGNLEANNATFRGTIYAAAGVIGGFTITETKMYGGQIQTGVLVQEGQSGVIMDTEGLRGYSSLLGQVFNLPTDGSAPSFSSGVINSTIFKVDTQGIIRTSDTVGDGTANSAGVLINNAGVFLMGPNQTPSTANVILSATTGNGYFRGNVDASTVTSSEISSANITGSTITGGLIRTATTGQRLEITSSGISLLTGASTNTYNSFVYGDGTKYGSGVLAYINNTTRKIPFYISTEQIVGDFHFIDRSSTPSGAAEVGDMAAKSGKPIFCTAAGTPGTWKVIPVATPQTGYTTFGNLSTDRTLDANSTTIDEVADVLGTLIEDLKATGIISA